MMNEEPAEVEPQRWIDETIGITKRTRAARQRFWFPLLVLGFITLGATPLYFSTYRTPASDGHPVVFRTRTSTVGLVPANPPPVPNEARSATPRRSQDLERINGQWFVSPQCRIVGGVVYVPCSGSNFGSVGGATYSSRTVALYWLIALTSAFLLIGGWYRRQARRRGVATSPALFIASTFGLVALLILTTPALFGHRVIPTPLGFADGEIRGVLPIVAIAIGLIVLGRRERSASLVAFAIGFLGLAALVDLYDLQNMVYRIGIHLSEQYAPATGVCFAGIVLTFTGAIYALRQRSPA